MALSARSDLIEAEINWKQRYEKEKKEKSKVLKQVEAYKQKLKKSKFEFEKTSNYYRKQMEIFKTKQTELLKHISSTHYSAKKQSLKYVFAEDIKQITLNDGVRRNASVHITFANGEESIFNNIDLIDTTRASVPPVTANINMNRDTKNTKANHELETILCNELEKRISDIDNLINITFGEKYMINDHVEYEDSDSDNKNDDISLAMRLRLIEYVNEIKMRHNQYNLINRIQQSSTTLDDIKHAVKRAEKKRKSKEQLPPPQEVSAQLYANKMNLQTLHENNALWRNLLLNFPIDIVGILCFELNDRIHDVQNVKDVLYRNEEALYESMEDIMSDIKTRHKDSFRSWTKTDNTHSMSEKWDNIIGEVAINNERWTKQIHFDPVPLAVTPATTPHTNNGYAACAAVDTSLRSGWLFKDGNRNEFLDSLQVNQHTVHLLTYIGAYINRMIPTMAHCNRELHELYIPIISSDPYNVLAACLDGVLFAILLQILDADCIDLRVLQLPQTPLQPLSENQISENMVVIFSTLEGLNLQLPQWSIDDYFDANHTVHIMLCVVFQVFHAMMDRQINLTTHPELIRLCQSEVEIQNAPYISWKKWLNKWLLHLKNPQRVPLRQIKAPSKRDSIVKRDALIALEELKEKGKENGDEEGYNTDKTDDEYHNHQSSHWKQESFESDAALIRHILHCIDYHDYLILICCRMDPDFLTHKLPQIQSHRNSISSANGNSTATGDLFTSKLLLECIINVIGTNTVVQMEDIASHNPLLQQLLMCDIFRYANNNKIAIHALSHSEKKVLPHLVHIPSKEERMFLGWMNAFFGDTRWHLTNLKYALNDGVIILRLLDKLKTGCVDWNAKGIKLAHEVRHKFDRLTNCKVIMDVCSDHFLFNLIGMNGSDIAEGNLKYINILLWHCMSYGSTRLLSEIKFNGKQVTDKMILLWTNNRIKQYKKQCAAHNNEQKVLKLVSIKSFRDGVLNDSILFLNLLSSICAEWVDYTLVHEVQHNNHHATINKHNKKERLCNATYCITICRKLGAKLFCTSNDICNTDPKAIASLITSIMSIAAKHSDTDQLLLSINTH